VKIIDLSQPVGPNLGEPVPVTVERLSHEAGAAVLGASHGLTATDFPDGYALSLETVTLTSHTGTHVDAPLHYGRLCEGRPAKSVDALPLEWFFGPGALLRFDVDPDLGSVSRGEMDDALGALGSEVRAGTIVLCDVGAARLWGTSEYFTHFRGIDRGAIELLLDRGVRVVGTDAFGVDPPFSRMLDDFVAVRDRSLLWPAHVLGRHREYCQIERLGGLDQLPRPDGFTVACFPVRLEGCGAAWARAVAIFDDSGGGQPRRSWAVAASAATPVPWREQMGATLER
jgi:kynurenine formamidase